jgi:SpoVK/Ycf46/Vps4 family AAA+-type ATPase
LDVPRGDGRTTLTAQIIDALFEHPGIVILSGEKPWAPSGHMPTDVISVLFPVPGFPERRQCWHASLGDAGIARNQDDVDSLATRFRLTPEQIADAVSAARSHARWREADSSAEGFTSRTDFQVTADDLLMGARLQSGHDLAALTQKINPLYTWEDIVLPAETLSQLREMCQRVTHRQQVFGEWGFDRKLSLGRGANALFAGSSGTGKTMAADIIANELGLDLYKIDLAGVVSKYIGETEKNLDRIFNAAETANAILFFDEADALFGKRSEVRDSHDRYANVEVSYLLQKMEQYEGIAILATNLRQNFDDAFVRRLAFTIHFPFPDECERQQIWARVWPAAVPLAPDADLKFLAKQFKLSGGNIKNIAVASAFLAAADGKVVTMEHLRHATQREYQKLGKMLSVADLCGVSHGGRAQVGK